jgi:hypothetical protein
VVQLPINPANDLAPSKDYAVSIEYDTFRDLAGNSYDGTETWNFTTKTLTVVDNTPPTIAAFIPSNSAKDVLVDSNLSLIFK